MLTLPIKKGWYDLIAGGVKKEEYREIKPYDTTRFRNIFGATWESGEAPEQRVIFRNGYSADAPQLTTPKNPLIPPARMQRGVFGLVFLCNSSYIR